MAELVHLVVADGLNLHIFLDILEVLLGGRERRDAGTREGDLGRGDKLIHHVRIARLPAFRQDLKQVVLLLGIIIEMMDRVGVVPVNAEIVRRRLQVSKTEHRLLRVGDARRVGVLGHAPDSLDFRIVVDVLLDHVHIRAVLVERDVDHLDSEELRDLEMAVVTRHRAEEFHSVELAPGRIAADTVGHGTGHRIEHDIERRVSENDHILRLNLGHLAHQVLGLGDAEQDTVVADVRAGLIIVIDFRIQDIHHLAGDVQLCPRGLAAGHVKLKARCLDCFKLLLSVPLLGEQLFPRHITICFHNNSSLRSAAFCAFTIPFGAFILYHVPFCVNYKPKAPPSARFVLANTFP